MDVTLVSKFCEHSGRRALYEYVAAKTPIRFEPNDSLTWGSQTVNGETTIFWVNTRHPEACLCHELLHAKLKIDGYKQYVISICRTDKSSVIARLLSALDNELPHHRFYPDFLQLGFSPTEMYQDNDVDTYGYIKAEITNLQGDNSSLESYFYLLISIIAPGGCFGDQERNELLDLLERSAPKRYWKRLNTIREHFCSYAESTDYDAGLHVARILKSLDGYDPTWISFQSDQFPDKGFFVESTFSLENIQAGKV